jgi:hypothetical protein
VRLKLCLLVVQGCVVPWHPVAHAFHSFSLLKIVDGSHFIFFWGAVLVPMVSFTAPTLHRWWSGHLFIHFSLLGLPKAWLSLRVVSKKGRLISLQPLLFPKLLLIIPSLPKSRPFSLLFIQAFFPSYCFFHSLGIIILDLVTNGRWQSTHISLNLDSLIFDERKILQ